MKRILYSKYMFLTKRKVSTILKIHNQIKQEQYLRYSNL